MMRVTPDASILVSGIANDSGLPAAIIDLWRDEELQLVISEHIISEMRRGWAKPYWRKRFTAEQIDRAVFLLREDADVTPITVEVTGVAAHAQDDLVLATAVSGGANYLITGDIEFRDVESYQGVVILTPREFLTLLEEEEEARDAGLPR